MTTPTVTRRSALGAACAAPLVAALPVAALAKGVAIVVIPSDTAEDAQFVDWEGRGKYWWARAGEKGIGDEATNRLADKSAEFEHLILETPSRNRVAALAKARLLLRHAEDNLDDRFPLPLEHIIAALGGAAA